MCRQRAAGSAEPIHVRANLGVRCARNDVISMGTNGWVLISHGHAQRQCSSRAAQSHLVCKVFLFHPSHPHFCRR